MKLNLLVVVFVMLMQQSMAFASGKGDSHPGFTDRVLNEAETEAVSLARQQLDAYNNRDIDAFLDAYTDDVKVYTFPGKLNYEGKEEMRRIYSGMFERMTKLRCTITAEIVKGNKVIHEESVVFDDPDKPVHAVCIYIIDRGKIAEAHFLPKAGSE